MTLDPEAYIRERLTRVVRPDIRPDALRDSLAEVFGGLNGWERPPLQAEVRDIHRFEGYRRETVTFTSRPGLTVFGYFLVPDGLPSDARRPGLVVLPGHGRGVDSFVGIGEDGRQEVARADTEYHANMALQCVANGYPTLAIELMSFGHRRRADAVAQGPGASSCHDDSMAALMLGETMTGWRVWDAIRALDYLETRSEVDSARIGTMGISGGGLVSMFTAALDTRVRACVMSAYLNTFADSVLAVPHCVDNYAPGLFALTEMPGIASLIAPRALYAESGRDDPIFPVRGFEVAVREVAEAYEAAGVPERFVAEIVSGGHRFDGEGVWPFLAKHL